MDLIDSVASAAPPSLLALGLAVTTSIVMLRAKEYFHRFWVKSAFIKALHKRYADERITIPFPIRALNFEQEGKPGSAGTNFPERRPRKDALTL